MKASVTKSETGAAGDIPGYFGSASIYSRDEIPAEAFAAVDEYVAAHPGGHERLIPVLHHAQSVAGFLPFEIQDHIADALGLSPIQVYEVVSFYHFFSTTPKGQYQLKVCMGTACFVRHAEHLIDAIQTETGLSPGELTEDCVFGLELVRCIGACGLAPAIMVNNEVHGNLDRNMLRRLLKRLRNKARVKATADHGDRPAGKETVA
ncbi:MAG: NAD(P)H-dependent oxidoreductase subunit E [Vicinamibacterales bacterium]